MHVSCWRLTVICFVFHPPFRHFFDDSEWKYEYICQMTTCIIRFDERKKSKICFSTHHIFLIREIHYNENIFLSERLILLYSKVKQKTSYNFSKFSSTMLITRRYSFSCASKYDKNYFQMINPFSI